MRRSTKAELILLCATFIWGSTFALGKLLLADMTPLQMVLVRFGSASLILLAFAWRSIFPLSGKQVLQGGILGLFLFLGFITQTIGLGITSASKSAFITGMMVIFVPLLQVLIERRAPRVGNILGVVTVSAGLWLLTSPEGSAFNAGDALTLACSVLFGVYIVYLDVVSREMTALQLTFLQFASNAVLACAGVMLFGPLQFHVSLANAGVLLYLTLFATVLTTYLQTRFQKDTTPTRAVVIFTVEPVLASILAYFILGEALGTAGIIGGVLIVTGVLISELSDVIPGLNRPLNGRPVEGDVIS